jgi:hypothetical protein
MAKKHSWTILPFIIIASLVILILLFFTLRKSAPPAEPLKAIPVHASMIIQINDYESFIEKTTRNNTLWNTLTGLPELNRMSLQMKYLDSLMTKMPEIKQIMLNEPSFLSVHSAGRDRIGLLHVFQLPARVHEKKITELIMNLLVNSGTMENRKYEGITLHEVVLLKEAVLKNFVFAVYHNILLISNSAILMEDAIRQLMSDESVTLQQGFKDIYATSGKNVDANVFVNMQEFPKTASGFVRADYKAEVRALKNFAGWAEMDLNLLAGTLLMNGFVTPHDSAASFAAIFLDQAPQRLTADQVMPASVASFLTLSTSDFDKYLNDYQAFLREEGRLTGYSNMLQSINNTYDISFPDDFLEIMDNEITLAFNPENQAGKPPASFLLLRIKSKAQAEEKMNSLMAKFAAVEQKTVNSYVTDFKLDNELRFKIGYLPVRNLSAKIFGPLFSVVDHHYFVVIENYLVFSSSPESLKELIHNQVLNRTLLNNPSFREFKNTLSPRSNILFYANLSKSGDVFAPFLTEDIGRNWKKYLPVFQQAQIFGFQLYTDHHMLYANLLLRELSAVNSEAQTVWESKLDTVAAVKPVFVLNHQTNQNEVFVQDLRNNIYLINQVGRVLWKVQLPEPVNSEVFQIDYFRNGKLQLLFSSRNYLYLIDRNGNFVEKYPVKLRSPATCGLSVFDYDNNRDYRLFIACEDKGVYAYSKEGSLLSGWSFNKSESAVRLPVSHFRIGDKDFIVFGDGYKTYILDRKGNSRVSIDTYFPKSANNNYVLDLPRDGSGPSFVTTDTVGKVYMIALTGKVKTLSPGQPFTNRHFFDCRDLNGDGISEFIYLEGSKLIIYNHNFTELFSRTFESAVESRPVIYQFSATDRKLGIVSKSNNLIYLINNTGDIYAGFPLKGNTPFSIGQFGDSLSRFSLVVGSSDQFLYNYRVK